MSKEIIIEQSQEILKNWNDDEVDEKCPRKDLYTQKKK